VKVEIVTHRDGEEAVVDYHYEPRVEGERPMALDVLLQAQATKIPDLAFRYGIDLGMAARSYSAWNQWLSGYLDQAVGRIQEAFAMNKELSHPYSHAHALTFAAVLRQFRSEPEVVRAHSEAAIALTSLSGASY